MCNETPAQAEMCPYAQEAVVLYIFSLCDACEERHRRFEEEGAHSPYQIGGSNPFLSGPVSVYNRRGRPNAFGPPRYPDFLFEHENEDEDELADGNLVEFIGPRASDNESTDDEVMSDGEPISIDSLSGSCSTIDSMYDEETEIPDPFGRSEDYTDDDAVAVAIEYECPCGLCRAQRAQRARRGNIGSNFDSGIEPSASVPEPIGYDCPCRLCRGQRDSISDSGTESSESEPEPEPDFTEADEMAARDWELIGEGGEESEESEESEE